MRTSSADRLAAELCCARLEPPTAAIVARARPGVAAALDASSRLPPLGLVADLATLLEATSPRLVAPEVPGLSLRRYDDRLIGPMLADRRRLALTDAYAALPAAWRGAAVAALAERVCEALDLTDRWVPADLRGWLEQPDAEGWAAAVGALGRPEARRSVQARLDPLSRGLGIEWSAADVHLIRYLPLLASRTSRVLVRQVLEASRAIQQGLVCTLRPRRRTGVVPTASDADDTYPAGGYSALTTSGSIENLVASELVYMDDPGQGATFDLFDLRYAQNELLYYTRDEATHLRVRRRIVIGLAPDLALARVKDPDVPWQRGVVALGVVHAVLERLIRLLGARDLKIDIHPVGPVLEREADALTLALRAPIDAGVLVVSGIDRSLELVGKVAEAEARAETDVVWISAGEPPPTLRRAALTVEVGLRSLEAWSEAAAHLLRELG